MPQGTSIVEAKEGPSLQEQAGKLLGQAAGYAGHRAIEMGLRHGIFEALKGHARGLLPAQLAKEAQVDPFYLEVWCRAAYGAEVLDVDAEGRYRLAPHIGTLLLDRESPAFAAGVFASLVQPEVHDTFSKNFATGKRIWWDECSPEWIQAVALAGTPFNTRFIPGGLSKIPGLQARLEEGLDVLELACGAGRGLVKLKRAFPRSRLVGLDGDAYSLKLAKEFLEEAKLGRDVELVQSTLEDLDLSNRFDLVTINISMHECRDIEKVAANIHRALRPGGVVAISDFPFPREPAGLRTVPGRIMAAIQFFEALIDDQLLPTAAFRELLTRHGFVDVGDFELTPVHCVVHGRKPS